MNMERQQYIAGAMPRYDERDAPLGIPATKMTELEHRTAAAVAKAAQRELNDTIKTLDGSAMCDAEFNRRMNKLGDASMEWALREIEHTQAAQRLQAANC